MFERFTTSARDVVLEARALAAKTGGRRVDAIHLLGALLGAPEVRAVLNGIGADPAWLSAAVAAEMGKEGLDAEALATIGIDLAEVSRLAEQSFGEDALVVASSRKRHIPFAPGAKKTLELALREAIRLHQKEISERLIMLGLLRADRPIVQLMGQYLDVDALQTALEKPLAAAA